MIQSKYASPTLERVLFVFRCSPQVCAEIGVSLLDAKFAQHIPLLVVVAPQLYRFYAIRIKFYHLSYFVRSFLLEHDH